FVLRSVPNEFGPSWSKNFAIEYSTNLSRIPNEETREAVSEIVSFVLGRRLIDIGDSAVTKHDHFFHMQHWDTVEGKIMPNAHNPDFVFNLRSWNPGGINVRQICSKLDFAPIPIDRFQNVNGTNIVTVLTSLAPVYLEHRKTLSLTDAL